MDLYNVISVIIILASFFAILNQRYIRLPNNVGVMLIAIVVSVIVLLGSYFTNSGASKAATFISNVDFSRLLIGVLLNFLLFAGTIQIRIKDLRRQQLPVFLYATIGVVISAFLIGSLLYWLGPFVGFKFPFTHWLLFGALISPTDPVSVLNLTRQAEIPPSLEVKIAGESLFNDGIALVLFVSVLNAIHNPEEGVSFIEIIKVFGIEVLGAILLGLAIGFIGVRVLYKTSDPKIHVMFSLAMVMGGQLLAGLLHVSAPLTMAAAGIFFGNYGKKYAINEESERYLDIFWEVIDEILNVILFALIGFQLLLIDNYQRYWKAAVAAVLVVLLARYISILLPSLVVRLQQKMPPRVIFFLTWSGLRGGVSIALALTLTYHLHKDLFVFITYCVVIFSVLVQGLTLPSLFLEKESFKEEIEEVEKELDK